MKKVIFGTYSTPKKLMTKKRERLLQKRLKRRREKKSKSSILSENCSNVLPESNTLAKRLTTKKNLNLRGATQRLRAWYQSNLDNEQSTKGKTRVQSSLKSTRIDLFNESVLMGNTNLIELRLL